MCRSWNICFTQTLNTAFNSLTSQLTFIAICTLHCGSTCDLIMPAKHCIQFADEKCIEHYMYPLCKLCKFIIQQYAINLSLNRLVVIEMHRRTRRRTLLYRCNLHLHYRAEHVVLLVCCATLMYAVRWGWQTQEGWASGKIGSTADRLTGNEVEA
jgi:hypothetical protein